MNAKTLEKVPLFRQLSRKQRDRVARWADEVDVPAGYHLLEQGRLPHEFFVLLDGTVDVTKDGVRIAELGPGDFFGEIAILEHERRTATVVATSAAHLLVMIPRDFEEMRAEFPGVAQQVHDAIRERMAR